MVEYSFELMELVKKDTINTLNQVDKNLIIVLAQTTVDNLTKEATIHVLKELSIDVMMEIIVHEISEVELASILFEGDYNIKEEDDISSVTHYTIIHALDDEEKEDYLPWRNAKEINVKKKK